MYSLRFLVVFLGLTVAAPLTSENFVTLDRRGSVECNVRYGWSLTTTDCDAALARLPVGSISGTGMPIAVPNLTPQEHGQARSGVTSNSVFSRLRESRGFTVNSGRCFIGINPPPGGGINLSDWGSIAGRVYNIIAHCVTGNKGQGGKDMAGPLKNIQVMVWQEEPNESTS